MFHSLNFLAPQLRAFVEMQRQLREPLHVLNHLRRASDQSECDRESTREFCCTSDHGIWDGSDTQSRRHQPENANK